MTRTHCGIASHRFDVPGYIGDITNPDGPVVLVNHNGISDLVEVCRHGEISHHYFLGGFGQEPSSGIFDGVGSGQFESFEGDAKSEHLVGARLNLELLDATTHGKHFGDSGFGSNSGGEGPVGNSAEVPRFRLSGRISQAYQHDFPHQRSDGCHVGVDSLGQVLGRAGEPLLDELPRPVDVGVPVEFNEDERQRDIIDGAKSGHAVHAHERVLKRQGDECFHLLRGKAGGFGENGDRGLSQVRENLDR